ncbi:MAG: rod shape-determining protein MreC [Candidatus Pacebacteria bacterium]|nr:rod shape-determining protein MreC [Candidatus Paceibacterota bacterium]
MPKKGRKILSIVLIICLFLAVGKVLSKPLTSAFHFVFSPLEKYIWAKGQETGTFFFYIFNAKDIYQKNIQLAKENILLKTKVNDLTEAGEENEFLKQALGFKDQGDFELALAQIISKGAQGDYILIDKGAKDGIALGMPVVSANSVLMGKVKSVSANFSQVALITAKDFSFDIEVGNEDPQTETLALAKGQGNLKLGLDFVDKNQIVQANSLVFTAPLGGNFPEHILVGIVESIQNNPAQAFQAGQIKPYFTDHLTQEVFIIKNFQAIQNEE